MPSLVGGLQGAFSGPLQRESKYGKVLITDSRVCSSYYASNFYVNLGFFIIKCGEGKKGNIFKYLLFTSLRHQKAISSF